MEVTDRAFPVATNRAGPGMRRGAAGDGVSIAGMRLTREAVKAVQREASDKTRRGLQAMTEGDVHQALLFYSLALNTVQQLFNVIFGGGVVAASHDHASLEGFQSAYRTSVATLQSDISKLEGRVLELQSRWRAIQDTAFGSQHAALQGAPVASLRQAYCSKECERIRASEVVYDAKRCGVGSPHQGSWFDAIIGMHAEKKRLIQEFAQPLLHPSLYGRRSRAVLLHGPPGTGKTLLAQALPVEVHALTGRTVRFFSPAHSDLKGRYVGESERNIRYLFKCAADAACEVPGEGAISMVFIDEIDSFMGDRAAENASTATISVVNALLQEMDGVSTRPNVIVVGATNTKPGNLDEAAARRFQTKVEIGLPDAGAIAEQLRYLYWRHIKGYDAAGASPTKWDVKQRDTQECIASEVQQCANVKRKWAPGHAGGTTAKPWDNLEGNKEFGRYVVISDPRIAEIATNLHTALAADRKAVKEAADAAWAAKAPGKKRLQLTHEVEGATQSDITSAWNSLIVTAGMQAMHKRFEKVGDKYLSTYGRDSHVAMNELWAWSEEIVGTARHGGPATVANADVVTFTYRPREGWWISNNTAYNPNADEITTTYTRPTDTDVLPPVTGDQDHVFVGNDDSILIAFWMTYEQAANGHVRSNVEKQVSENLGGGNKLLSQLSLPDGASKGYADLLTMNIEAVTKDWMFVILKKDVGVLAQWWTSFTLKKLTLRDKLTSYGWSPIFATTANGRVTKPGLGIFKELEAGTTTWATTELYNLPNLIYRDIDLPEEDAKKYAKIEFSRLKSEAKAQVLQGDHDKCATWTITETAITDAFDIPPPQSK